MVLGLCSCFGAGPATEKTATSPPRQLGGESMVQKAVGDQEAHGEAGERKMVVDQAEVVARDQGKKEKRAPILVHHFPFHSRPGLL
ncbi:hypothetical protein ACP70R_001636 [Stipagrostis hirtigluma subsp. patula]